MDTEPTGADIRIAHRGGIVMSGEVAERILLVDAKLRRQFRQYLVIADIEAEDEIGLEQRIDHTGLDIMPGGEADHPMGIDRIWRALDGIEIKRQAITLGRLLEHRRYLQGPLATAEFQGQIGRTLHARGNHVGVQLKRQPFDRHVTQAPLLERTLKPVLANIAPGTNHICEDFDQHGWQYATNKPKWESGHGDSIHISMR